MPLRGEPSTPSRYWLGRGPVSMSRAYSLDLRERVVASMRSGLSSYAAAAHYQVSQSSAQRWFNRAAQTGSPRICKIGGYRRFSLEDELPWIRARPAETSDLSLHQLLAELNARGLAVSYFAVWNIVISSFWTTSAATKTAPCDKPSGPQEPNSSSSRLTAQTSTPLNRHSPNSKHCCAKPMREPSKRPGKALGQSSAPSNQKSAKTTSSIQDMHQSKNIRL